MTPEPWHAVLVGGVLPELTSGELASLAGRDPAGSLRHLLRLPATLDRVRSRIAMGGLPHGLDSLAGVLADPPPGLEAVLRRAASGGYANVGGGI